MADQQLRRRDGLGQMGRRQSQILDIRGEIGVCELSL